MHPCIVCGKTIQHDEIFQHDLTYKNKIIYQSTRRIVNLICDDCIADGWIFASDRENKLHVVKIAPSTEPDTIFTETELILEGDAKCAVDRLSE